MSNTARPHDSGRRDALGRPIKVSDQDTAGRSDAPTPPAGDPPPFDTAAPMQKMSDTAISRLLSNSVTEAWVETELQPGETGAFGDEETEHTWSYRITGRNSDGTWTVIDSAYGLVNHNPDGDTVEDRYTTASCDTITVCTDPADPGGTEISSEIVHDEDRLAVLTTLRDDDTDDDWIARAGGNVRSHAASRLSMFTDW